MKEALVEVRDFSFTWPGAAGRCLNELTFNVNPGEILLCTGGADAGKSSLLLALSGLIPHRTGGRLKGDILINGCNTRQLSPREISHHVGISFQQPQGQFFTLTLKEELAFSLEQRNMPPEEIEVRIEEALAFTGLEGMKERSPQELSGGEMQRASLAILLAQQPSIYLLDEPLAALDRSGRQRMIELLKQLRDEKDAAVVICSKSPMELLDAADHILLMNKGTGTAQVDRSEIGALLPEMERSDVNLSPLYDLAGLLKERGILSSHFWNLEGAKLTIPPLKGKPGGFSSNMRDDFMSQTPLMKMDGITFRYCEDTPLLEGLNLKLRRGEILWLAGDNGTGKSTLMKILMGLLKPSQGSLFLNDDNYTTRVIKERAGILGLALQNPDLQLFASTLMEELSFGPRNLCWPEEQIEKKIEETLQLFSFKGLEQEPPMMMTFGMRKMVALASIYAMDPDIYLLDEPDWSMDRQGRGMLTRLIQREKSRGKAFIVISHNQEYISQIAHNMLLLRKNELPVYGPVDDILYEEGGTSTGSPLISLAKMYFANGRPLSPRQWLACYTGEEVQP